MRKLNILNLATSDHGGAGVASLYLNELFNKTGHNSWLFVKDSISLSYHVVELNKSSKIKLVQLILRIINHFKVRQTNSFFNNKYCFFNTDESKEHVSAKEIHSKLTFKPDVIVIHWVSNFVNVKTINELAEATNAKIVWLMMDNAHLTGGCHYPWDCFGFHTDCSNCPAILHISKKDIPAKNLSLKKEFLPSNSEVIACSEFDYLRANQSLLFRGKTIHKVLLTVDENKYIPADKLISQRFFEIEQKKKIIFYGSLQFSDVRKGGRYFLEAISYLQDSLLNEGKALDDLVILVAGTVFMGTFAQIKIPIKEVGYLNEESLIKAFQAADVFVSTSVEDSGPLMINQSIMCGTPVASFGMGVAYDLVHNGITGYRAKLYDCDDLAFGIKSILQLKNDEYLAMSAKCREMGLDLFKLEKTAKNYIKIFKNI